MAEIFDFIVSDSEERNPELDAILFQSLKLQKAYNTIFPKVTSELIQNLFAELQENTKLNSQYI